MGRRKKKAGQPAPRQSAVSAAPASSGLAVIAAPWAGRMRPWLLGAVAALLVVRPLFPSELAANFGDGLLVVMLWLAMAVLLLLGAIGRPTFSVRFGWTDAAVLALVAWQVVAGLWAVGHASPRPALNMLWEWVGLGVGYLLVRQLVVTAREARTVIAIMVALAMALSVYGLYKSFYEMPRTRAVYAADPDQAMRRTGLWHPPDSPGRKRFEDRLQNREPLATFALTNSLAAFLAPWLVVLAGMVFSFAVRDASGEAIPIPASTSGWSRLLSGRMAWRLLACAAPIAVCLLLTKSRSAYLATGVGLTTAWALCGRRAPRPARIRLLPVVGTVIVLAAALVAAATFARPLAERASTSLGYRLQYWRSTLDLIADHPFVGCGPGNFQFAYTQYKLPEASEEVADPHNFLLEVWATAGTPAMLAFLAVLATFVAASSARNPARGYYSDPQPVITDASLHLLVGGACGFLLSIPLGMLSAAPPGWAAVGVGLPAAAIAIVLLWRWIREGRLPPSLPLIAVAVLLIDLLASGGVGMPSVAGSFWLLLAVGLQDRGMRQAPLWGAWAALSISVAAVLGCYLTAYRPVFECQAEVHRAEREPDDAIKHLEAAAAADRWSAEPWRQLAAIELEIWRRQPNDKAFVRFEKAKDQSLRLAPNSSTAWLDAGDWYATAYSQFAPSGKTAAGHAIGEAVKAYGRAVELYPNSATNRAKLAEAHHAAGDQHAFRLQAQEALRLDAATPHADKKLPMAARERLRRWLAGSNH